MLESLPLETIEAFCDRVEIGDECWKWLGKINRLNKDPGNVRGVLWCGRGIVKQAHIVSWMIKNGELPTTEAPKLIFRNLCGDVLCVNPDHWLPIVTAADVFWMYVQQETHPDECWGWSGYTEKHRMGYGRFKFNFHQYRAHRFSYELHHGPIPDGLMVLHSCHNPQCTNPRHLRTGTAFDNVQDAIAAGRNAKGDLVAQKGSQHWKAKLTEADVKYILAHPEAPRKLLAQQFGVTYHTIANIRSKRQWKHVSA